MPQALKPSDAQSVTLPGTTFGANLTVAREHVGLSREQLGTRAGLNAATIYRLEAARWWFRRAKADDGPFWTLRPPTRCWQR